MSVFISSTLADENCGWYHHIKYPIHEWIYLPEDDDNNDHNSDASSIGWTHYTAIDSNIFIIFIM
jgi:hypothetical protein